MSMKKTPLLLAFGKHPGSDHKGADTNFFKKSVVPFLENQIESGKNIIILKEAVFEPFSLLEHPDLASKQELVRYLKTEEGMSWLKKFVAK